MSNKNFTYSLEKNLKKLGVYSDYKSYINSMIEQLSFNELQEIVATYKRMNKNYIHSYMKNIIKKLKSKDISTERVRKYRKNTKKISFQVMVSKELKNSLKALKEKNNYKTYEDLLNYLLSTKN